MSLFGRSARDLPYSRDLRITGGARVADKPVWPLEVAEDAILECAREGAAIAQGQILVLDEGGLTPLPWDDDRANGVDLIGEGSSVWGCRRVDGESWGEWQARSLTHAIEQVRTLTGRARLGSQRLVVDLAWVTEDELALFELPAFARAELDAAAGQGTPFQAFRGGLRRMAFARAAPGSYYGPPAERIADVPVDARVAWIRGKAGDLHRLPALRQLEVLAAVDLPASSLPILGTLGQLRALSLGDVRFTTLDDLRQLRHLTALAIGGARRLTDWSALATLPELRVLSVAELWLTDLAPLAALTQLIGLHVHLPRAPASLAPLASLVELRHLHYWGGTRDGALAPLAVLTKLRALELRPRRWTLEAFADLAAALPDTDGPHRSPIIPAAGWQTQLAGCRCGVPAAHYTLGKPARMLCASCDADKIARHVARWEIMVSAARARSGRVAS